MIPETSTYTCRIRWHGPNNTDYDTFNRLADVDLPGGDKFVVGGAHLMQDPAQTNPEELFAASVGCCMMLTILAVFSRSKITVLAYEDSPEALLEYVERRFRITKVTLRPHITLHGSHEREKLDALISKAHANCFVSLSVRSEVIVEPTFITA